MYVCVCVCVCRVRSGQSKEAVGGRGHCETIPQLFSTNVMVYFTCRQGHGNHGLMFPRKATGGSLLLSQVSE